MRPKRKIAVVGYGAIGRHHARNLASLEDAHLVGIVETSPLAAAEAIACGYTVFPALASAIEYGAEGIVIAAPTSAHHMLALEAVCANKAVLVEKPIAGNMKDGESIVAAARKAGVALMIGYVERYNPAAIVLKRFMSDGHLGRLFSITARRLGVMPARMRDANVLIDVGVHDIDMAAFLVECPLQLISALGGRALLDDRLDFASLAIDARGIAVHTEANWITPVKVRQLLVTGENGVCQIDYITQKACFASRHDVQLGSTFEDGVASYRSGEWTDLEVRVEEPLRRELRAFLSAMNGDAFPDPGLALVSLQIAEEATNRIEQRLAVLL